MSTVLLWLRNDLRLHDNLALHRALALAATGEGTPHLIPVVVLPDVHEASPWGPLRWGPQRRAWRASAIRDLAAQLDALGCPLAVCAGPPATALPRLAQRASAQQLVCEDIPAPEEALEVADLRRAGLTVHAVWHSSLLEPAELPWQESRLPAVFTAFRQAIERAGIQPRQPLPAPQTLPPWPPGVELPPELKGDLDAFAGDVVISAQDSRSSLPMPAPGSGMEPGGERAALAHLTQYLARGLPHSYKRTRNGLTGVDFSSKWSPALACGALSARRIMADLRQFESFHGASDGSYWLWFELLWRDHFRFLHRQHGARLFRGRGLSDQPVAAHNARGYTRWCEGRTGWPLVDAAMRELAATGSLSNRLRQVVASVLVHDLGGDWRAGAAWFEHCLVDFDVCSNQGNWLYIAGRGTDPRGGRRMNVDKQAAEHDPHSHYRQMWSTA
ncbi:DASH family cryptochrome [Amphibiibacter pelophylacis]|uniref:DASH family cryptochrome n=1 Tax=Amphibiibacter pelophylacis TaxID=1799477 RepID=A0ACC6NYH3_9BURK